ncbi:hypothetical protein AMK27_36040 [Streptomyces sp. CB02009]|nr:hypothetical protein AMK27_36040 [Streptomyces sp. CB02009]
MGARVQLLAVVAPVDDTTDGRCAAAHLPGVSATRTSPAVPAQAPQPQRPGPRQLHRLHPDGRDLRSTSHLPLLSAAPARVS